MSGVLDGSGCFKGQSCVEFTGLSPQLIDEAVGPTVCPDWAFFLRERSIFGPKGAKIGLFAENRGRRAAPGASGS